MKQSTNARKHSVLKVIGVVTILVFLIGIGSSMGSVCTLSPRHVRETVLKEDLQEMRKTIDEYKLKNRRPPQGLGELVVANLLRTIPADPITRKADWAVVFDHQLLIPDQKVNGITDVRSNSNKISSEGSRYNSW